MKSFEAYIKSFIEGKRICVLGFGREGRSTLSLFQKAGGFRSITICDDKPQTVNGFEVVSGEECQKNLDRFDVIMKSPGVVMKDGALSDYSKLFSQTELFISFYREQIIGITGTKGKSTVTTLIYHVLERAGKNPVLLGNIGIPAFDGDEIEQNRPIVLELSSHQLQYVNVSPKIAVFLNVFPEHLDHYKSFDEYYDAKKNIYLYQKTGDALICHDSVLPNESLADVISFGKNANITVKAHSFTYFSRTFDLSEGCPLIGSHNVNNVAAAYAACRLAGVTDGEFFRALETYTPLPHRLERIGEKNGIIYYDDSISTIPQTAIEALNALENVGTLLVGGMDRGVDFSPLVEFLKTFKLPNLILMYDSGRRVLPEMEKLSHIHVFYEENLVDAVALAKKITPKGSICLLSPSSASYGFFKNFEERGDKFKEYALS